MVIENKKSDGSIKDFGTVKESSKEHVLKALEVSYSSPKPSRGPGMSAEEAEEREKKERERTFTQWQILGNKMYTSASRTSKTLPPGFYQVFWDHGRVLFREREVMIDELIKPKDCISDEILKEISKFWEKGEIFAKYGFLHTRGYLFYGKHGSGKTSIVHMIADGIIANDGLVLLCDDISALVEGVSNLRQIEPNRAIVCVFEDLESLIRSQGESVILSFLDGEFKTNKILNIATTNYPELLNKRIVGRPRRFDRIIKIEYPDEYIRTQYFLRKLDKEEAMQWAKLTDGLSYASLAELVIGVKCLENGLPETLERLRDLQDRDVSIGSDRSVGFMTS